MISVLQQVLIFILTPFSIAYTGPGAQVLTCGFWKHTERQTMFCGLGHFVPILLVTIFFLVESDIPALGHCPTRKHIDELSQFSTNKDICTEGLSSTDSDGTRTISDQIIRSLAEIHFVYSELLISSDSTKQQRLRLTV